MHYINLGRTGLQVSRLCLGTLTFGWSADESTSFAIMDAAVDAGINFLDTADIYSRGANGISETIIGKWLKTKNRREVVLATKVRGRMWAGANGEGLSRAHILHAVEDSLRRLQTDYIDLYQTHYPDDSTPMEETQSALDSLVKSGKVRYLGASNYPAWRFTKSLWISDVQHLARFDSLQPHYSLLHRNEFEWEMAEVCRDQGIGVIPYSPLAAGFLTGKYSRQNKTADTTRADGALIKGLIDNEGAYQVLDACQRIATGHGVPVAQVALAWQLSKPVITSPIIGARTTAQLGDLVGAVDLQLSEEEIAALDKTSVAF